MPLSALQKRIIELSSRLIATDDVNQFKQLAAELRKALHEHVSKLRLNINDARKHIALAAHKVDDDERAPGVLEPRHDIFLTLHPFP